MSNIPEQFREKLKEAAKEFCKKDTQSADVIISSSEYSLPGLISYHEGAEFGYSLASERIGELERGIKELQAVIANMADDYNELERQAKVWKEESGN